MRHKNKVITSSKLLDPAEFLRFVYFNRFCEKWEGEGLCVERDLPELEFEIMLEPKKGNVITRSGGLRKLRFSPESWKTGKSGALRVFYYYSEEHMVALMINFLVKNQQEDINHEDKRRIRKFLRIAKKHLDENHYT